ncbi:CFEM domain-containing protein [Hirsutella rhossiliensis]|uniref:CFEM domain-containing protein n=1 Tax=Hirsutella rhossiliensis TaxID=111463 RepID=A0A9P8MS74_9HYPO|nr:CFEM domain-containing protein [Hirsutella rhossiliensis]KAH0960082.1 CFEM domain-containing protein [Hirsutella rhossiliensis]
MQFKALLINFAVAVAAQDLSGLPACSAACFQRNFGNSGCADRNDFACLCQYGAKTSFTRSIMACVLRACEGDDMYVTCCRVPVDLLIHRIRGGIRRTRPRPSLKSTVTDQTGNSTKSQQWAIGKCSAAGYPL